MASFLGLPGTWAPGRDSEVAVPVPNYGIEENGGGGRIFIDLLPCAALFGLVAWVVLTAAQQRGLDPHLQVRKRAHSVGRQLVLRPQQVGCKEVIPDSSGPVSRPGLPDSQEPGCYGGRAWNRNVLESGDSRLC